MPRQAGSCRRLFATWHADDHRSCFSISASNWDRPLLSSPRAAAITVATTTIAGTVALPVIAAAVTASGA